MRQYYEREEEDQLNFAHEAARHFEKNLTDVTYSKTAPEKGGLMALRWGMGCDCVVVFRISSYDEVVNYCQFIDKEKARRTLEIFNNERKDANTVKTSDYEHLKRISKGFKE